MRGLPQIAAAESFRVRRYDAVVLGGALPGLVAAIRLAQRGARVLVLEEALARSAFQGAREPYLMTGAPGDQVLGACLRELGLPLIDQRRFEVRDVALQVALPDARVDLGRPGRSIDELTAWGLAKPATARALLTALHEAAEAERLALLAGAVARCGRRVVRGAVRAESARKTGEAARRNTAIRARGLPAEVAAAPADLRLVLAAATSALACGAGASHAPEAEARLLGSLLGGGAVLGGGDGWLRGMLRRRLAALFGEFRSVSGPMRLVGVAHQAGVAMGDSDEIWAGRALVLNAPRAALATHLAQDAPDGLRAPAPTRRRVCVRLHGAQSALPESMGDNVVWVRDPGQPLTGTNAIAIRRFAGPTPDSVDVLASAWIPAAQAPSTRPDAAIESALRGLLPFSEGALQRAPLQQAEWDHDDVIGALAPGEGWPRECEVRLSSKPPVYALERAWLGGLGFEGDLLLGWQGGDAIAQDLS
jgi:hypothetical protein